MLVDVRTQGVCAWASLAVVVSALPFCAAQQDNTTTASSLVITTTPVSTMESPGTLVPTEWTSTIFSSTSVYMSSTPGNVTIDEQVASDVTIITSSLILASASNSCENISTACIGDITHYEGGPGVCEWTINTGVDMQVALLYQLMGAPSKSNRSPYCGRHLVIRNPVTAVVTEATDNDECTGCPGRSLSITEKLFQAVGGGCGSQCSGFQ